ncbi:MAG: hypothetical protein OXI54_15005 [Chloroflexota bacterium]|nr:hypothetical protein [Chloroflexota bacterium]MDE2685436.1 hypothetical protein [Chloroflexota bacterium]
MAEKIYIRNASGELEPLTEERFETEDLLQQLIGQHPELLAGDQMRPHDPLRWILIKREMPIEGWALDHLLIDQHSRPTLVEVKRGANREIRRNIVGQMLDYAATAASVWSERDMRRIFEESSDDPDGEISILLQRDEEPVINDFWEEVATNLAANRLRLLFVADEIPDELERVVKFLNEQTRDNLEVLAVEVKQYPGQFGQALVSRVIGQVNTPRSSNSRSPNLSPAELLDSFRPDVRDAMLQLIDAVTDAGGQLRYRRTAITVRGRCSQWQRPLYLARFYVSDGGRFEFTIDYIDGLPEGLRTFQKEYIGQFSGDEFVSSNNGKWGEGWAVNSDAFVEQNDVLTHRLCTALRELSDL